MNIAIKTLQMKVFKNGSVSVHLRKISRAQFEETFKNK